jgi:hypothetical protein
MLKEIGTRRVGSIERLLDRHVRLNLFVRVQEDWRNDPRLLDEARHSGSVASNQPNSLTEEPWYEGLAFD